MHFPLAVHDVRMNHINNTKVKMNFASKWDIVQLAEGIIILLLNTFLFCLILSSQHLRSKIPMQFFLNLQLVHILISVLVIFAEFERTTWQEFAYLVITANALLMELFVTLMISTCDRFYAIKFPFEHGNVTKKQVTAIICFSWLPSLIFVVLSVILGVTQYQLSIMTTALIALATVVLSASNIMIFIIAKKHERFLHTNARGRTNATDTTTVGSANRKPKTKILKASYACFAVVFSFVLFWAPFLAHSILAIAHIYTPSSKSIFTLFVEQFALVSFLIDPILLMAFSTDIQMLIKRVICKKHAHRFEHTSESKEPRNTISGDPDSAAPA